MITGGVLKEEIEQVKKNCKIGDRVKVFNHWREGNYKLHKANGGEKTGKLEYSRIVKKYKHIVVLDNRRCMSYAELALQRRQKEWCICEPEKRHL